ncbi:LysR substrate-binding domain-containing protein [Microvirga sp. CF3016]|uniref:LysR substrate-binding domain-containing protein n=1 Tax=Microvirga sp. CF3016 TaxID=3110181 RepID=UPI003FA60CC4
MNRPRSRASCASAAASPPPALSPLARSAGLGLARVLEDLIREPLSDSRLVEVLADWSPRIPSWYLYYPGRRHTPTAFRAFLDFARRHSRSSPLGMDTMLPDLTS